MPQQVGPPSGYLLSWRPWMCALLVLQTFLDVCKIFLLLDIMGGFIMSIIVGLGWYAWKEGMHITFICYWGVGGAINGTFELVSVIDAVVHMPKGTHLFSSDAT